MNYLKLFILLALSITLFSCEDDQKERVAQAKRISHQNDSIVKALNDNWKFTLPSASSKVQQQMGVWNEWNQLRAELSLKPAGNLAAYRQKTKDLVRKAELARNTIPAYFSKPQVKSRFDVLVTKVKSLHTFISVDPVNTKKVFGIMAGIDSEAASIFNQFDEMIRIKEIPREEGEEEMLRALDTVRMANPGASPQPPASSPAKPTRTITPAGHGASYIKQKN